MVTEGGIRDARTLRAWLEGRSPEDARVIAARAALRAVPFFWAWARKRQDLTELPVARLCLTLALAAHRPEIDYRDAARSAIAACENQYLKSPAGAANPAFRAAVHAAYVAEQKPDPRRHAETAAGLAAAAQAGAAADVHGNPAGGVQFDLAWRRMTHDAVEVEAARSPFALPLWPDGPVPDWVPMIHRDWGARGGGWEFWADWYEGYLDGQPLCLDLLEKVARIPDEEWQKGDDHVNEIIAGLYDAHRIATAAARLEADLVSKVGKAPGIGHNRPPEEITDPPLVVPTIQEPLRAIRSQALAPRPDKQAVSDAIDRLRKVISILASYTAGKLDLAVDELIKTVVPWALKGVIAWYGANKLGLAEFIEQATRWLAGL